MASETEKYLEPGTYLVRATYRAYLRVENDMTQLEVDAVDDAVNGPSAELVDFEVKKIR